MRKNLLNDQGFAFVSVFIIFAVLAVVGGAGWYVYHRDHKPKTAAATENNSKPTQSVTTGTKAAPNDGMLTYSDSHTRFMYPTGWQAGKGQDKYTPIDISVASYGFTTSAMSTTDNPGAPITLSLQLSTDSSIAPSCTSGYTCQVVAAVPLTNSQLPNASLAVVNQTSPNGTNFSQYAVVSNETNVDDTNIKPLNFGSNVIYIFGQPYYTPKSGGPTEAARVTDGTALQSNTLFKHLVDLINSVRFK